MRKSVFVIFLSAFLMLGLGNSAGADPAAAPVIWDTVSSGTVRLAVSNHGSMGLNGIGGANMDFTSSGLDCDPTADIYLKSGGPFIIQKIDSAVGLFSWSTGLYQNDATASFSFQPDGSGPPSSHFVGPDGSDAFFTGRFLNWDSTIGVERTYYAPTTGSPNDNFIIVRTDFYPVDGLDHPHLAIGEVNDWDIPSDSGAVNYGWIAGRTVYLRGTDMGTVPGCQPNSDRFGASVFLGMHTSTELSSDDCTSTLDPHGNHSISNVTDANGASNGIVDSSSAWNWTQALSGEWVLPDSASDQRIYLTFVHGQTLKATDTLTAYTALISIRNGQTGLLDETGEQVCDWYDTNLRPDCEVCRCCKGTVGNVDGEGGVDIADLSFLIDHLFFNFPPIDCPQEGNVDADGGIDIADLAFLIDYLFINFHSLPVCP